MHHTVVDSVALQEHLADPEWCLLDTRPAQAYTDAHIPGAFWADTENDLAGEKSGKNGRHPLPEIETFASFLRGLGVSAGTQLVAYDAGADMFAARFWFLCRWIGHDAVAVLDGGIAGWQAAGYPLTSAKSSPRAPGNVRPKPRHELIVHANEVRTAIDDHRFSVLDARSSDRFAGHNEHLDAVAGHIPGALNRFFKENYDQSGRFKSPEHLRSEFSQLDLAPERVVHQCGSGVSAAVNQLAMEHAGLGLTRIYAGSWSEWIADPRRPIATGAP
ncbi:MAG: sulfurtransferase [Candidatus Baltobacteraceae bacterium]